MKLLLATTVIVLTKFNRLLAPSAEEIFAISESTPWVSPVMNRLPHQNVHKDEIEVTSRYQHHISSSPETQAHPTTLNLLTGFAKDFDVRHELVRETPDRTSVISKSSLGPVGEASPSHLRPPFAMDLNLSLRLGPPPGGEARQAGIIAAIREGNQGGRGLLNFEPQVHPFDQDTSSACIQGSDTNSNLEETQSITDSNSPGKGNSPKFGEENNELEMDRFRMKAKEARKKINLREMTLEDFLKINKN